MDFNIEVRKKQLDNLNQLISSSRDRLESVLHYLGWSAEVVAKEDPQVSCPVNPSHRISPESWNTHIEKCILKTEGYSLKDQFLSESIANNPTQSIYLDRDKKIEIITKEFATQGGLRLAWNGLDPDPRTADRLTSTFSPDERLAFYNYCIENTAGPPPPPEFTTIYNKKRDENKPLTYEEQLSLERDAKRRRAKYRSVHINRKNHTEVIREVINGQMEEYAEWLTKKQNKNNDQIKEDCNHTTTNGVKIEEDERPHSSVSRHSTLSNSSRSTYQRHDRRKDRREKSRDRSSNSKDYNRKNDRNHRSPRKYSRERDQRRNSHSIERRRSRDRRRRDYSRERRH